MEQFTTAKLFKNGNSQAVRLPKEFRFEGTEVLICRKGKQVIIKPKPKRAKANKKDWADFFLNTPRADPDFMKDYQDLPLQERDFF